MTYAGSTVRRSGSSVRRSLREVAVMYAAARAQGPANAEPRALWLRLSRWRASGSYGPLSVRPASTQLLCLRAARIYGPVYAWFPKKVLPSTMDRDLLRQSSAQRCGALVRSPGRSVARHRRAVKSGGDCQVHQFRLAADLRAARSKFRNFTKFNDSAVWKSACFEFERGQCPKQLSKEDACPLSPFSTLRTLPKERHRRMRCTIPLI